MKIKFLVIGVLYSVSTVAQNDYIRYYQLINKVYEQKDNKQTDSLVILFSEAFGLVDYVHLSHLKAAKKIAKKQKDDKLYNFCVNSIARSKESIDYALKSKLDSVSKEDQRIRGSKFYAARDYSKKCLYDTTFQCDDKKYAQSRILMEEWGRVDSSNIEYIRKVIKDYGYPGEKMVGETTNNLVGIIILHYDKDTANHIMGDYLYTALKNGAITPKMYAWIIDRHLMNAGKEQSYYSIPTPWKNMNKEQRQIYNENRYSIGLEKLEDVKIIVRKNSVVVKNKR